jgi:diacylglycerol kinase family enzyme
VRRATVVMNPRAGGGKAREGLGAELRGVLEGAGVEVEVVETQGAGDGAGTGAGLAAEAAARGVDTVFACGGDGTVHEVLQGLVGTEAALGVVPVGTANALARNLGLSMDPVEAVRQQLGFVRRRVAVGVVRSGGARRYFAVMAGAGPDGMLVYRLLEGHKGRLGRWAYYGYAARLFLTQRFRPFVVRYRAVGSGEWRQVRAVSAMAVRVPDLGGVFGRLMPGVSLLENALRLVIVKPPAGVGLPLWFAMSAVGLGGRNPWVESVEVEEFCMEGEGVHAQVDGEWLGRLPVEVGVRRDGVWMLMGEE